MKTKTKLKKPGRLMWLTYAEASDLYLLNAAKPFWSKTFKCWVQGGAHHCVCFQEFHKTSSIRLKGGESSIRRVRVTIELEAEDDKA